MNKEQKADPAKSLNKELEPNGWAYLIVFLFAGIPTTIAEVGLINQARNDISVALFLGIPVTVINGLPIFFIFGVIAYAIIEKLLPHIPALVSKEKASEPLPLPPAKILNNEKRGQKATWIIWIVLLISTIGITYLISPNSPLMNQDRTACQAILPDISSPDARNLCRIIAKESQKPMEAAGDYAYFLTYNSNSPLASIAKDHLVTIFENSPVEGFANRSNCSSLMSLLENKTLSYESKYLPALLNQCGSFYYEQHMLKEVIQVYDNLWTRFPTHPLTSNAEGRLAEATVLFSSQKYDMKYNFISQSPFLTRNNPGATSLITIANGSSIALRLAINGPDKRIKQIAACETCKVVQKNESTCPIQGPSIKFELNPGQYEVILLELKDFNGVQDPEYGGRWKTVWEMKKGGEYSACFVLVPAK